MIKYEGKCLLRLRRKGVGWRREQLKETVGGVVKTKLQLFLGFSHPILLPVPDGVELETHSNKDGDTLIRIKGVNESAVGNFGYRLRSTRGYNPYSGQGFHREDGPEPRRKLGKRK